VRQVRDGLENTADLPGPTRLLGADEQRSEEEKGEGKKKNNGLFAHPRLK
jgi:hypothetical protein